LGGEPRCPNNVRSSHNAMISVSGPRVRTESSVSAERFSAPNTVSANRRSIACCNSASTSAVGHSKVTSEQAQNLALTLMRVEARTTAGAQTTSEARPRRNCRRGATTEPIVRIPRRSLKIHVTIAFAGANTDVGRTNLASFLSLNSELAEWLGFVDLPNRGSLEQQVQPYTTSGFALASPPRQFARFDAER